MMSLGARGQETKPEVKPEAKLADVLAEYKKFHTKPVLDYIKRCQEEAGKELSSQVPYYDLQNRFNHLTADDKAILKKYAESLPEYQVVMNREYKHSPEQPRFQSLNYLVLGCLFLPEVECLPVKKREEAIRLAGSCFEKAREAAEGEAGRAAILHSVLASTQHCLLTSNVLSYANAEVLSKNNQLDCGVLLFIRTTKEPTARLAELNRAVECGYVRARGQLSEFVFGKAKTATMSDRQTLLAEARSHLMLAVRHGDTVALASLAQHFHRNGKKTEMLMCADTLIALGSWPLMCYDVVKNNVCRPEDVRHYLQLAYDRGALRELEYKDAIHLLIVLSAQKDEAAQKRLGLELRQYFADKIHTAQPEQKKAACHALVRNIQQNFLTFSENKETPETVVVYPLAFAHAVVCLVEDKSFSSYSFPDDLSYDGVLECFNQIVVRDPEIFFKMHEGLTLSNDEFQKRVVGTMETMMAGNFLTLEMLNEVREKFVTAIRLLSWNNGQQFPGGLMRLIVDYADMPVVAENTVGKAPSLT